MNSLKSAIDKEIQEAKRERTVLNFKKKNSLTKGDKWYYIGQLKQLEKRLDTLCYLWAICKD